MGYNTRFSGRITIDPPLTWAEIKDSPFVGHNYPDRDIALQTVETPEETDEGTLTRRVGIALVPVTEDSYKGYSIVEHVQEFVTRHGEGRTFTGRIDAEGEEAGDIWRLSVRDGRAVKTTARIVWDDEEPK